MRTSTVADIGERALIARIVTRLRHPPSVIVGPGDDAAVLKPERGRLQVVTTDALVDGVHFDSRFVPADAIGHRALAVNLSDLAAMGATPHSALLSLVLPDLLEVAVIDAVLDGMLAVADRFGVALVGGNVTRTPGPFTIDVTALGSVHPRRVLRRDGARAGDDVYVTGTLGGAAIGLRLLRDRAAHAESRSTLDADDESCARRYLRPEPRVRAGVLLGRNRAASSCMDLSDGLADGVRQVAEASGVGMIVDAEALPVSDAARAWHARSGGDLLAAVTGGGDDYELLFTCKPAHRGRLRSVRRELGDLPITRIGAVTRQRGVLVRVAGELRELPQGFEHFR